MPRLRGRKMRLDDFERRARLAPTSVDVHPNGWRYMGIHPFADDTELLRRIGVEPSDCIAVDAWCQFGDDVCFVEVHARDGKGKIRRDGVHVGDLIIGPDAPMLRALRRAEAPWGVSFSSVVPGPVVDRASFERALELIAANGLDIAVQQNLLPTHTVLVDCAGGRPSRP
jgi:hypothetical protein